MKKLIFLAAMTGIMFACTGNKTVSCPGTTDSDSVSVIDSIPADTVAIDSLTN